MASMLRNLLKSRTDKDNGDNIVSSSEIHAPINYLNWSIPKEKVENFYNIGLIDFRTAFSIRTHEETRSILHESESFPLLNKDSIKKYIEKGHRYAHFGLAQIAVKPLAHIGVDTPIYLALRDKRLKRYQTSLLAMVQTNICNGPIYFNCSPNFSVDLTDPMILESLVLDVQIQGDEFHICKNFAIMFRVYLRLMSSNLNPKFSKNPFAKGETILLQVDAEQSTTYTPKRLKWNEMTIPSQFIIKEPQIPRNIERKEPEQIIEEPDGTVTIKFDRTNSFSNFRTNRSFRYEDSRASCSEMPSSSKNWVFKTPIPQPNPTSDDNDGDSYSPTRSSELVIHSLKG